MAFLCQKDSYLKSHKTSVISCEKGTLNSVDLFKIKLKECIFFPEGGGQPYDLGTIDNIAIECVKRDKSEAIIYCKQSFDVGKEVDCVVDWQRRFDHMQQHTAQHVLSQILEDKWKLPTVSWELGSEFSNVELDLSLGTLNSDVKNATEREINQYIREGIPVIIHNLTREQAKDMFGKFNRRDIPQDAPEPIRVVEIKGVDMNMCCGTHVSNLRELQALTILHEVSTRGKMRLYFIAGNRVLNYIQELIGRQNLITSLLNNGPKQHCQVIENLKNNQKQYEKENSYLIKEISLLDSSKVVEMIENNNVVHIHREVSSGQYTSLLLTLVMKSLTSITGKLIIATSGGLKGVGQFCLLGEETLLKKISEKFLKTMDGKGSVNKQRFQGKLNKMECIAKAISDIKSEMST